MKVSTSDFSTKTEIVQEAEERKIPVITVLTSRDQPVNKKYSLDSEGQVQITQYQNAARFNAAIHPIANIVDLANLLDHISHDPMKIMIRGLHPLGRAIDVPRKKSNFPEDLEGTPWVMLDFDNVPLPQGLDPLSAEAIEWVIAKLPVEFQGVSYFYQFSSSSGILGSDGTPKKKGLNVHLFFWFSQRIPGEVLAAYLRLHCLQTGFYWFQQNKGGVWDLKFGIDPAPIRSAVQAHYVALPEIGPGVQCRLVPEKRQDLIRKSKLSVSVPALPGDIVFTANHAQHRIRNAYLKEHGYLKRTLLTHTENGVAASDYYTAPDIMVRGGRTFIDCKLSGDGEHLILYFDDENTPGSWFVAKKYPQMAHRFGDGASMALRELSEGAHRYVRDTLRWFIEIPRQDLALNGQGYLPALGSFATAKVSLVLAPTGSGKTMQAIEWIRPLCNLRLVIYAAPTIALVNQMKADLEGARLEPMSYHEVWPGHFPNYGVVVTTNESLPRILKLAHQRGVSHDLILDEIHAGLDDFMRSNRRNELLERAIAKTGRTLLLTGTLTTVQKLKLVDVALHALGSVENFCIYEFQPAKRNPLYIRPLECFGSDLVLLLEDFAQRVKLQQPLPRTVLILPTSQMKAYENLLANYGLSDYAYVVSRPENTGEEIEAARTGARSILISSPLFALGLNFEYEPEIFWCSFQHISADTNQIIQTVNRANRGNVRCVVRIYVGKANNDGLELPSEIKVKQVVEEGFLQETSLKGLLEEHLQIDRNVYRQLRVLEKNTAAALGELIENDAIQNYRIVTGEGGAIDKAKAGIYKQVRKVARGEYLNAILLRARALQYDLLHLHFWKLAKLNQERMDNWRTDEARTELAIQTDAQAIALNVCGLTDPAKAKRVELSKVQRLFGERLPWVSAQYDPEKCDGWARAMAEKTRGIVVVLRKLQELKAGEIDGFGLAASLTRNTQLSEGFLALANGENEYLTLRQKFNDLATARERARKIGSNMERARVKDLACDLVGELLAPLGVFFEVKGKGRERFTDYSKPIVPQDWDVAGMIQRLEGQERRLSVWPVQLKKYPVSDEDSVGEKLVPKEICNGCVYFDQGSCSLGHQVDWQGGEFEGNLADGCAGFRAIRVKKAA